VAKFLESRERDSYSLSLKEAAKLGHEAFEVRIILFCILLF
jgi:hypothetical protein